MTKKYRWDSAHEWLIEKARSENPDYLRGLLISLIPDIDPETIEDVFRSDMEYDGFFREVYPPSLIKRTGENEVGCVEDANDEEADWFYDTVEDAMVDLPGEWRSPTDEEKRAYGYDVLKIKDWEA